MSNLSIKNLIVQFGEVPVLRDLNLDVEEGEFLVLLGSSGCGKSTLLNSIAGLVEPAGGSVFIGGNDVTRQVPDKRGIAMVFQSYALYPKMTVRQNLGFALQVARVGKVERNERINTVADFLQIADLLDRKPAQLSGGQRQRVAIGRALVREAQVFLFDEPLSNLDAKLRVELRVEIKRLHRSTGKTMIYVTHDQIEALTLADRIAIMKDGVIQQLADPETIYDTPANRYVAGFIGTPRINFLTGQLTGIAGGAYFEGNCGRLSMDAYDFSQAPEQGMKVELGIRPEMLNIVDHESPEAFLHGTVDLTEMLGSESILWCDIAGQQVAVLVQGKPMIESGSRISLSFNVENASLFASENGLRI